MFIPWVKVGVASSKDDKMHFTSEYESHSSYIPYMGPIAGVGFYATTNILNMYLEHTTKGLDPELIKQPIECVFELLRNSESDSHNLLKAALTDITAFGGTKAKSLNAELAIIYHR